MDNLGLSIWQAQECMAFTYSHEGGGGGRSREGWGKGLLNKSFVYKFRAFGNQ